MLNQLALSVAFFLAKHDQWELLYMHQVSCVKELVDLLTVLRRFPLLNRTLLLIFYLSSQLYVRPSAKPGAAIYQGAPFPHLHENPTRLVFKGCHSSHSIALCTRRM